MRWLRKPPQTADRGPIPDSVKALVRERRVPVSPFPLRDSYGRTWAERKALEDAVSVARVGQALLTDDAETFTVGDVRYRLTV